MARSIHAVRIPALFDEFWALVLARTGSPAAAREITHRIVADVAGGGDGRGRRRRAGRAFAIVGLVTRTGTHQLASAAGRALALALLLPR